MKTLHSKIKNIKDKETTVDSIKNKQIKAHNKSTQTMRSTNSNYIEYKVSQIKY